MKNLFKLFGIIALVAVIGLTMTACGDDDGGSKPIPGPQNLRAVSNGVGLRWDAVAGAGDRDYKLYKDGTLYQEDFDYGANNGYHNITGLTNYTPVLFEVSAMVGGKETQKSRINVLPHPVGSRTNLPLGSSLVTNDITAGQSRLYGVAGNAVNDAGTYQIGLRNSGFPLTVYLVKDICEIVDTRYRVEIRDPAANFPSVRLPQGEYGIIVSNTSAATVTIGIGIQRLGD